MSDLKYDLFKAYSSGFIEGRRSAELKPGLEYEAEIAEAEAEARTYARVIVAARRDTQVPENGAGDAEA